MAYYAPFNGNLQSGITGRFGWPDLGPHPVFGPMAPAFQPQAPQVPQGTDPASMAGALGGGGGGMSAALDPGRGGWNGQSLGQSVAQSMTTPSQNHNTGYVGAGLSAPMPGVQGMNVQGVNTPASMTQALNSNPGQLPQGYAPYNGAMGIPYEPKRSAMANPLDFLGTIAPFPGGLVIGAINEIGKRMQPQRYIGTLGKAIPGVPQTSASMGAVYGYGPSSGASTASLAISRDVAAMLDKNRDIFGSGKSGSSGGGGGKGGSSGSSGGGSRGGSPQGRQGAR